jgi:hypothetical protein
VPSCCRVSGRLCLACYGRYIIILLCFLYIIIRIVDVCTRLDMGSEFGDGGAPLRQGDSNGSFDDGVVTRDRARTLYK